MEALEANQYMEQLKNEIQGDNEHKTTTLMMMNRLIKVTTYHYTSDKNCVF
jgi:hypothetical protein